jgi:hypothetical protein
LEIKFWSYATVSAVLVAIDLGLLVRLIRQIRARAGGQSGTDHD